LGILDYNKKSKIEDLVLNTQSFREKEIKIMSIELGNKFNLSKDVRLNKNKNLIVIKSQNYRIVKDLTSLYIISSMIYKLHT